MLSRLKSLQLFRIDKDQTCQANEKHHRRRVIRLTLFKTLINLSSFCISVFSYWTLWMIFVGISKLHSRSQNKNVHCERCGFKFSCICFKTFKAPAHKRWPRICVALPCAEWDGSLGALGGTDPHSEIQALLKCRVASVVQRR